MAKKRHTRFSQRKCAAVVRAIHDVLYLDVDEYGQFHNAAKEWDVDMLESIAGILQAAIPRPPEPPITCIHCAMKKYPKQIHYDRDRQPVCNTCLDDRMR